MARARARRSPALTAAASVELRSRLVRCIAGSIIRACHNRAMLSRQFRKACKYSWELRMRIRLSGFAAAAAVAAIAQASFAAGGSGEDEIGAPSSRLQMAMTLYAAGITIGKVDMDATIRDGQYHVVSNLSTSGVVNAFWQSEIQATSTGKIGEKTLEPTLYDSFDTNHASKKQESHSPM